MDLNTAIKRTIDIIFSPTKAWKNLSPANSTDESEREDLRYLYLLLGVNVLFAFIGKLIEGDGIFIVSAILNGIFSGTSFYCGFWLVLYITINFLCKHYQIEVSHNVCLRLVTYSFVLDMVLNAIMSLMPSMFFLHIITLYTIYIVWEGVGASFDIDNEKRSGYVLWLAVLIVAIPFVIQYLLNLAIPSAS